MEDKLILIDGNSLINRAFFALPPMVHLGKHTNAVYGFINMVIKLIEKYRPKFFAVAFDLPGGTFRNKKYSLYKANRKGMPTELAGQLPLLKSLLNTLKIAILEMQDFEADDLLGTACKKIQGVHSFIVTADRDCLQLIDSRTTVLLTKKGITEILSVDQNNIIEHFSLKPLQVIDYKALCGDASDNIPGVAGIGEKTAITLLNKYCTLDGVYANIENITGAMKAKLIANKETAFMSFELAKICIDAPLDIKLEDLVLKFPFLQDAKREFAKLNFKSIVKREELFEDNTIAQIDFFKQNSDEKIPDVIIDEKVQNIINVQIVFLQSLFELQQLISKAPKTVYFCMDNQKIHINFGECLEYIFDNSEQNIDINQILFVLLPLFDKSKTVIVYDAKALMHAFKPYKLHCKFEDLRLMQYLLDHVLAGNTLREWVKVYGYGEEFCFCLYKIKPKLSDELQELKLDTLYYEVELPLINVLFNMELRGFAVNIDKLKQLQKIYVHQLEELSNSIKQIAGVDFNVQSPKQLTKILFEDLKLKYPITNAKTLSTSADILQQIDDNTGIIVQILKYREIAKLNSTYVEGLLKASSNSSVVHTDFRQMSVATGRLSSVEPNLQNIPIKTQEGRNLRKVFEAREGYSLICADYSQIELRLLAHLSGDRTMIQAFNNGDDIHAITASKVFGVELVDVTKEMRRAAKAVNFGIVYGISDFGLSQDLKISVVDARQYIQSYFAKYSSVKSYLDDCVATAKDFGYIRTLMGRLRRIPELNSPKKQIIQYGERIAMNMPMQGSASDLIKKAMILCNDALKDYDSFLIHQVHDELIVECIDSQLQNVVEIIEQCMSDIAKLSVPLVVDVKICKQWQ
ncbi:MAG: DNA polymerase I [Clostridiales bacterium]|jgi:DNA polymerase-1|nr:DNA polymerase I [Clostridiales bacterium]